MPVGRPGKGINWWQVRGMEKEQLSLICEAESGKRWEDAPGVHPV